MRHWILIAFYLLKDICRRWREMPGALAARLLVTTILCLLMLFLQAAFFIAARDLESRITRLGANRIIITASHPPVQLNNHPPSLENLIYPLANKGDVVHFRKTYITAKTEFGEDCLILTYSDKALSEIVDLPPAGSTKMEWLATSRLPAALPVEVNADPYSWQTTTIAMPPGFETWSNGAAVLLIPETAQDTLLVNGWQDICLISASGAEDVPNIVNALELLLQNENFVGLQIISAKGWQEELRELRTLQTKWQLVTALSCGALIVLIFSSIALLEYRQNAYIATLIRSFGIPAIALIARYLVEALTIVTSAGLLAHVIARTVHQQLFQLVGFDPHWTSLSVLNPYEHTTHLYLVSALGLGAFISILPVAVAMRRPVGTIL